MKILCVIFNRWLVIAFLAQHILTAIIVWSDPRALRGFFDQSPAETNQSGVMRSDTSPT